MMVFIAIYGVVDGYYVSNYSSRVGFAAVNFIFPFIMLLQASGFMIGTGGSALVGKTLGEKNRKKADELFSMFIFVDILLGLIFTFVGLIFVKPVSILMGASGELLDLSILYGSILALGCIPQMLHFLFEPFLITAERPKLGLSTTIIAGVGNMVLDYIFVYYFKWGVAGAGAATVISQCLGGFTPLIYFMSKRNDSLLHLCKFKMDYKSLLKSCANGFSELLSNISMSLSGMVFNIQLMKFFGQAGIEAYGVIMYVNFLFVSSFIGYSIGTAPIVSYHYGAKNHDELHSILKKSLKIISITSVLMVLCCFFFCEPITSIFISNNQELFTFTVETFKVYSVTFFFCGFAIYASDFFTALNDGITSAIISFLKIMVFEIGFVFILPYLFGGEAIFVATALSCFLADLVSLFFFIKYRKKYGY